MPCTCLNQLGPNQPVTKPSCAQRLTSHSKSKHALKEWDQPLGLNNPRGNITGALHQPTAGSAHGDRRKKMFCDEARCVNQLPAAQVGGDGVKTLCGQAGADQKPAVAKQALPHGTSNPTHQQKAY